MFDGIVNRMYNEMGCVPKMYKSKYLIDGYIRNWNGGNAMYNDIQHLTHKYCHGMNDPNNWMYAGNERVQITAPADRKDSVWIGGSILSTLDEFKEMRIL